MDGSIGSASLAVDLTALHTGRIIGYQDEEQAGSSDLADTRCIQSRAENVTADQRQADKILLANDLTL